VSDPAKGSDFRCPRTVSPSLRAQTRRALNLGPDDPIPRCWQWGCPGCWHLRQWGVRRYLKLGALEAAERTEVVCFSTLTERGVARSWDQSSAALTKLLGAENEVLRRRSLPLLRYAAVPELQKRGAVHWHLLLAMPRDSVDVSAWRSKHQLHKRALAFGFGFQADVQQLEDPRAMARSAGYLAKYLTKDERVAGSVSDRFRRIRSSTGSRRWCSFGTVGRVTRDGLTAEARCRVLAEQLERGLVPAVA
jgi:hypothetical protein